MADCGMDSLDQQVTVMRVAPTQTLKRKAVTEIFEKMDQILREKEISDLLEILSSMILELGPGDAQMREGILDLLQHIHYGIESLLQMFPVTVLEWDERIFEISKNLLRKTRGSSITIIECLFNLPIPKEKEPDVLQLAYHALSSLPVQDSPRLVEVLLSRDVDPQESAKHIREHVTSLGNTDIETKIVEIIVQSLGSGAAANDKLSGGYEKILEKLPTEQWCALDWYVLLVLFDRKESQTRAKKIIDRIVEDDLPWKSLFAAVDQAYGKSKFKQSVLSRALDLPLIRLSVYLLLTPVRIHVFPDAFSPFDDFIILLVERLKKERQTELIQSLFHLADEPARPEAQNAKDRKIEAFEMVTRKVCSILEAVTSRFPSAMMGFHTMLKEKLLALDTHLSTESIQSTCRILVRLVSVDESGRIVGLDVTELIMLVQKLLFSAVNGGDRLCDTVSVTRGLVLVRELMPLDCLRKNDRECLVQWTLQQLLPSSSSQVHPEIGSQCVRILAIASDLDPGDSRIFDSIKRALANSGLVQLQEQYDQTQRKYASTIASPTFRCDTIGSFRRMIFCFAKFTLYHGDGGTESLSVLPYWVFNLLDLYFELGRSKTRSSWKPEGWLLGGIELPLIQFETLSDEDRILFDQIQACTVIDSRTYKMPFPLTRGKKVFDSTVLSRYIIQLASSLASVVALQVCVVKHSFDHFGSVDIRDDKSLVFVLGCLSTALTCNQRLKVLLSVVGSPTTGKNSDSEEGRDSPTLSAQKVLSNLITPYGHLMDDLLPQDIGHKLLTLVIRRTNVIDDMNYVLNIVDEATNLSDSVNDLRLLNLLCWHLADRQVARSNSMQPMGPENLALTSSFVLKIIDKLPLLRKVSSSHPEQSGSFAEAIASCAVSIMSLVNVTLRKSCNKDGLPSSLLNVLISSPSSRNATQYAEEKKEQDGTLSMLTSYTGRLLLECRDIQVTSCILHFGSLLACTHDDYVKLLGFHLSAMFTIYEENRQCQTHLVETFLLEDLTREVWTSIQRKDWDSLHSPLLKVFFEASNIASFEAFRRILLRYICLGNLHDATGTVHGIATLVEDFCRFILGTDNDNSIRNEKSNDVTSPETLSKRGLRLHRIPILSHSTFLDFFKLLLSSIALSTLSVDPLQVRMVGFGDEYGPYVTCSLYLLCLRKLLVVYLEHFQVFTKAGRRIILRYCKTYAFLVNKLTDKAVAWRSSQPMLSSADLRANKYDPGAVRYLQKFVHAIDVCCISPLLNIIELWTADVSLASEQRQFASARNTMEKSKQYLCKVCNAQNLTAPAFNAKATNDQNLLPLLRDVKGFHETVGDNTEVPVTITDGPDSVSRRDRTGHAKKKRRVAVTNLSTSTNTV